MDKIIEEKNGEYSLDVTLHLDLNYDRIAGLKIDGVSDADILKRVKKDIIVMQSVFIPYFASQHLASGSFNPL